MAFTAEILRDNCQLLFRELTRLEHMKRPLSTADFFEWSENQ